MNKVKLFFLSLFILLVCGLFFVQFLAFHEVRVENNGWVFKDPVFEILPRINCSVAIFSLTYGSLILYFILERKKSLFLTKLNLSYALLLVVRMVTLSFVPLKIPESLIYLQDPFLNNLIYPGEIAADLFFSGHTALIFIFFSISKRWVFAVLTLIIGVLLIVQRVHYSIDVIAAIPFAFAIVWLVERGLLCLNIKE